MIERKILYYNGTSLADYGVYISGDSVYNAPPRVYDMVDIPGRNGQLAIDMGRYENIEVTYPCFLLADTQTEFAQKIGEVRSFLSSVTEYAQVEDTYLNGEYRMGIFSGGLEVTPNFYNRVGQFDLIFNCKPQRFLKSGDEEQTIDSGDTLTNPTLYTSYPLIEAVGVGTLTVGNITVTITGDSSQDTFIDCELMDAYSVVGGAIVSMNDNISLSGNTFPTLPTGETGITFSGLTSVSITPRWWTL